MVTFAKKLVGTCILLFCVVMESSGQPCKCAEEFLFLKNHIEANYAGFSDKVHSRNRAAYEQRSDKFLVASRQIFNPAYCAFLLNNWLDFFKDKHIQIRGRVPFLDSGARAPVALRPEVITLSGNRVKALEQANGLEGIYWSKDSLYRIALIRNRNSFREYAGVVLFTSESEWTPGQVKLELKQRGDGILEGIAYHRDHSPRNVVLQAAPHEIGDWQREGTKRPVSAYLPQETVVARALSEKTFYIQISSFNQKNAERVASLFKKHQSTLERMPNLVLDVRDNGGGSDFVYEPILPYLFTNSIISIGGDVWATKANIAAWRPLLGMLDIPEDEKQRVAGIIQDMQQHEGQFVSMGEDENITYDHVKAFPQRVVVLMNKESGSTTEQFLLTAQQSKKVILMGENSAGVLDYANMRAINFQSIPYSLFYATTRSRRIDSGSGIDNVGVAPAVRPPTSQDWVKVAQHYLESRAKDSSAE